MIPEQLEELADVADMGGYIGAETADCIAAARAAAASMRQPITAEALKASGWFEGTGKFGGTEYTRELGDNDRIAVWFANDEPAIAIISMGRSVYVGGAETMYDLGELVRLLGGAK